MTAPAPSPAAKPSRFRSNGLTACSGFSLSLASARIEHQVAWNTGTSTDSQLPAMTAAASPRWIACAPAPMAAAPVAQALTTATFGPRAPVWMEMWPLAASTMKFAMRKGETRRGPRVCRAWSPSQISS